MYECTVQKESIMKRRILITGATSGIGLEVAKALVNEDVQLILGCRNLKKADEIWGQVRPIGGARIEIFELDLSSFESIDKFSLEVEKSVSGLDVLVNNAGLYMDHAKKTHEGFEMTIGVNHIGSHYLTHKMIPLLLKGESPQILNVCSKAAYYGKVVKRDDFFQNHPFGFKAYSTSKLLQLMATMELAKQLKPDGISVNAIHPGGVNTNIFRGDTLIMKIVRKTNQKFTISAQEAAKSVLTFIQDEKKWKMTGGFFEKDAIRIKVNPKMIDPVVCDEWVKRTEDAILAKASPKKPKMFKLGERSEI